MRDREKARSRDKAYRERHKDLVDERSRGYSAAWRQRNRALVLVRSRESYKANAATRNAQTRAVRAKRKDEYNARRKAYRDANRQSVREYDKQWRSKNREAVVARKKRYRDSKPDEHREQRKRFAEKHSVTLKQRWREKDAKRRAQKLKTTVEDIDYAKVIRDANGVCGICRKPFDLFGIHVDHIVPLAKGGTHTYDNLQATHAYCNMAKGAKVG